MKSNNNCSIYFVKLVYRIEEPSEEMIKKIGLVLSDLSDKEERILRLRFGLDDNIKRTYKEIGNEFGLTGSRIHQIVKKAIKKLLHPVRKRKLLGQ